MSSENGAGITLPDHLAVSVRDVGKCYRLYNRPLDRLKQGLLRHRKILYREVWAVRGVSFDLPRGSALGIVGRNGAGKSTLLQVLAGTLHPTEGLVVTRGRVVALLELGSSFNTEFTGRENVFLYAAALGISSAQMQERLDAILSFADIGDYIDQPLRTYSSGMVMRLAFSVQAHVDPSVLIVDEALSVGDLHFQHKCIRHINRLREQGVTLLFVSHGPDAVKRFCEYGIWLEKGEVMRYGSSAEVVDAYLASLKMERAEERPLPVMEPAAERGAESVSLDEDFRARELALVLAFEPGDGNLRLAGNWEVHDAPVGTGREPGLVCFDRGALGFRFAGRALELKFMRHGWSGRALIGVDDEERVVELYSTESASYLNVNFHGLGEGEHRVIIQTLEETHPESQGREVWLIGAHWGSGDVAFKTTTPEFEKRLKDTRYGTGEAKIHYVELLDETGQALGVSVPFYQKVTLRIHAEILIPEDEVHFSFIIKDKNGLDICGSTDFDEKTPLFRNGDRMIVDFVFPNLLAPGSYSVHVCVARGKEPTEMVVMDAMDIAAVFEVYLDPNRPVWYTVHVPVEVAQRM